MLMSSELNKRGVTPHALFRNAQVIHGAEIRFANADKDYGKRQLAVECQSPFRVFKIIHDTVCYDEKNGITKRGIQTCL